MKNELRMKDTFHRHITKLMRNSFVCHYIDASTIFPYKYTEKEREMQAYILIRFQQLLGTRELKNQGEGPPVRNDSRRVA
jgi:hypothetical protein